MLKYEFLTNHYNCSSSFSASSFSALTPLVEQQEGYLACVKLGVGLLVVMI